MDNISVNAGDDGLKPYLKRVYEFISPGNGARSHTVYAVLNAIQKTMSSPICETQLGFGNLSIP
jgi:hypothetical protein